MEHDARESQIVARSLAERQRETKTRLRVRLGNTLARFLITTGGIGTIVAICLVFLFLISIVAPLFFPATIDSQAIVQQPGGSSKPVAVAVDEYQTLGWSFYADGTLVVFRLDTGATISRQKIVTAAKVVSAAVQPLPSGAGSQSHHAVAVGLSDGSVQTGRITFAANYLERRDLPARLRNVQPGQVTVLDNGVLQITPAGQLRHQKVETTFGSPLKVSDSPVRKIAYSPPHPGITGTRNSLLLSLDEADVLRASRIVTTTNPLSGETNQRVKNIRLAYQPPARNRPTSLLVTSGREHGFVLWPSGELHRYDFRQIPAGDDLQPAEKLNVLGEAAARVTQCALMPGGETLMVGDSAGRLAAWFVVRETAADTATSGGESEVRRLRKTRTLPSGDAAVTSLGVSQRSRLLVAGYTDGALSVFHVTTSRRIATQPNVASGAVEHALIAPKDDGLIALAGNKIWRAALDPAHPEATIASLFLPVWYEGYNEPTHRWQSTFASAAPEMKLGLWPLIFGTLKATFYTMLFAAPLALMAAVHTSEFMHPAMRNRIKPTIELMASLPSVVLGFLAAMIFAPLVEHIIPSALASIVTFPLAYLLAAHCWQLLPRRMTVAMQSYRLIFLTIPLPVSIVAAFWLGPWIEYLLLAGDVKRWLDGQTGDGAAAWLVLWLPMSALLVTVLVSLYVNPALRPVVGKLSRLNAAIVNLLKFIAALFMVLGLAFVVSWFLNHIAGWDPRGSYVSTYEQRNAFVVGIAMGFAVIPVVYTLADDALATVPQHLRSGSLGCGATPWQTAVRIVIPTAMSGLFSALMVGLGRAAGETMIVLMATGNTPLMETNMFNGLRALSANIAIELPDAVTGSTHYRTLFLAGLTLFVFTFFLNTIAEIVRTRFRKRTHQL